MAAGLETCGSVFINMLTHTSHAEYITTYNGRILHADFRRVSVLVLIWIFFYSFPPSGPNRVGTHIRMSRGRIHFCSLDGALLSWTDI